MDDLDHSQLFNLGILGLQSTAEPSITNPSLHSSKNDLKADEIPVLPLPDARIPPILASQPKQQPPLFWKAFGIAIKNRFTSSGSLYDQDRALFIGDPGQAGVPQGVACPPEVTNYQLYLKADAIQALNSPTFSLRGGSYFEFLNLYLKHVGDSKETSEVAEARHALTQAKTNKDQVWRDANSAYLLNRSSSFVQTKGPSLVQFLGEHKAYAAAWDAEAVAEKKFAELRAPSMSSLSNQLDLLRLADMRLESQKFNNMPVVVIDEDYLREKLKNSDIDKKDMVDPNTVFYRPLYSLPNYEAIYDAWIEGFDRPEARDGPYNIPLADIWHRKWADLGHADLDDLKMREELNAKNKKYLNSLEAKLTFIGTPQALNVNAGLWDVPALRNRFPLLDNAPKNVKHKVCKTSKIILAWGLEIELVLPEGHWKKSVKNETLALLDIPLKEVSPDGQKLKFQAGGDGYPILIGVIADVV